MHFGEDPTAPAAPSNPLFTPLELGLGAVGAVLLGTGKSLSLGLAALGAVSASIILRKRTPAPLAYYGQQLVNTPLIPRVYDRPGRFYGYGQQLVNTPLAPRVYDRPGRY